MTQDLPNLHCYQSHLRESSENYWSTVKIHTYLVILLMSRTHLLVGVIIIHNQLNDFVLEIFILLDDIQSSLPMNILHLEVVISIISEQDLYKVNVLMDGCYMKRGVAYWCEGYTYDCNNKYLLNRSGGSRPFLSIGTFQQSSHIPVHRHAKAQICYLESLYLYQLHFILKAVSTCHGLHGCQSTHSKVRCIRRHIMR